jgi:hypothetical protein
MLRPAERSAAKDIGLATLGFHAEAQSAASCARGWSMAAGFEL